MPAADEIEARLRALGTEERRQFMSRSAPSAMECLGVVVPQFRPVVRDVAKEIKKASPKEVMALVRALIAGNTFEGRHAAYELLSGHKEAHGSLSSAQIEALGEGMDNWVSVDIFSTLIAGPAWRVGTISDETIEGWAASDDLWWRRAAVVCTIALNQKARGGTGDTPRTLKICELLVSDQDVMVIKGLSWALREVSKRDPEAAREFLEHHDANLAARIKREVRNKLRTGLKIPKK